MCVFFLLRARENVKRQTPQVQTDLKVAITAILQDP